MRSLGTKMYHMTAPCVDPDLQDLASLGQCLACSFTHCPEYHRRATSKPLKPKCLRVLLSGSCMPACMQDLSGPAHPSPRHPPPLRKHTRALHPCCCQHLLRQHTHTHSAPPRLLVLHLLVPLWIRVEHGSGGSSGGSGGGGCRRHRSGSGGRRAPA